MSDIDFSNITNVTVSGDEAVKISLPDGTVLWEYQAESDDDYVVLTFNTTAENQEVNLISEGGTSETYDYFLSYVDTMIVDGKTIEPTMTYVFEKAGLHTVKYKMADNTIPYKQDGYSCGIWSRNQDIVKAEIGNNITGTGSYALFYCNSLTDVTIGSGVKRLGQNTLERCSALKNVILKNVTTIAYYNFEYCTSLENVTIYTESSVPSLALYTFTGSDNYKVYVPSDMVDKYKAAYNWKNIADRINPIE